MKPQDIQRQVFLNGWIIDFYLPKKDLYIEIDGVYWHGLDRPLSEIKKFKTKRDMVIYKKYLRDREQDKWFKANNLVLMRFTDKQIKEESVVKCIFQ